MPQFGKTWWGERFISALEVFSKTHCFSHKQIIKYYKK